MGNAGTVLRRGQHRGHSTSLWETPESYFAVVNTGIILHRGQHFLFMTQRVKPFLYFSSLSITVLWRYILLHSLPTVAHCQPSLIANRRSLPTVAHCQPSLIANRRSLPTHYRLTANSTASYVSFLTPILH